MFRHEPVLLNEVIENLNLKPGDKVFDGTIGGGGHALEILKKIGEQGKLTGFDQDPEAIQAAQEKLREFKENILLINDNYRNLKEYGHELELLSPFNSILLDLGVSSHQIKDTGGRGFSFKGTEEPLDMRMDPRQSLTAAEILNTYLFEDLRRIFKQYGEEERAKKIACRVVENRNKKKFGTVADLLKIIPSKPGRIHPATKVFQALRIAVNDELGALEDFLPQALENLKAGGRLAVISFHSLEDRIVKHFFQAQVKTCVCPPEFPECRCEQQQKIKIITKKPIVPTVEEIARNPRARSAKLRVAERI